MNQQNEIAMQGEILSRVIGAHVPLVRCGATYLGPCPFEEDEAETFHVDPLAAVFYCSGCRCEGDLTDWLIRFDRCSGEEATRAAAELMKTAAARAVRAA